MPRRAGWSSSLLLLLVGLLAWPQARAAVGHEMISRQVQAIARHRPGSAGAYHSAGRAPGDPVTATATHKGQWRKLAWPAGLAGPDGAWLGLQRGVAVLKLQHLGRAEGDVIQLQGEMVLRDGPYLSSSDQIFSVQGVHVPAAGRLMAVAEPAQPIRVPAALRQRGRAWEEQQRGLDLDVMPLGQGGEARQRDELLQAAARHVATLARAGRGEGQGSLPDTSVLGSQAPLAWQACEFMLDLEVRPAPRGAQADGDAPRSLRQRIVLPGARRPLMLGAAGGGRVGAPALLNGSLVSRGCGVSLSISLTTTSVQAYYAKAVNYTLMITALGFLQALLLAVLDAYLCLVHLTLGIMIESLLHSFGTVAFMLFVVFAIFELRFLLLVSRARRGDGDPWAAQREVSLLYSRFYAALLGGILLTYQLQRHMPLLLFAFFSYWWPQVALCLRTDCRQPLKPEFVLGTSAARLALPLYVYGCPSNLLRVQPNPALCAALVAYVGLQCGLLLAQHRWGPRCFVPRALLPRRYDYGCAPPSPHTAADIETGEGSSECVICMNQVDLSEKTDRAVTPCLHYFHRSCLERWLSYKHDCPTCRRPLPPL